MKDKTLRDFGDFMWLLTSVLIFLFVLGFVIFFFYFSFSHTINLSPVAKERDLSRFELATITLSALPIMLTIFSLTLGVQDFLATSLYVRKLKSWLKKRLLGSL